MDQRDGFQTRLLSMTFQFVNVFRAGMNLPFFIP